MNKALLGVEVEKPGAEIAVRLGFYNNQQAIKVGSVLFT